eukprot:NODE_4768_length_743_cov_22.396104_g4606_i0.p1 GENE.NODE_4768_length_743_cov_22.396104_g4606_i0~~NODE_4768_length_743_cov_22.396104_g4606_i0.p1  ORF type:complete len:208 (-),score=46.30 NODE_4768_length_743_cov_22.396104_g4606_i0:74-697(-)
MPPSSPHGTLHFGNQQVECRFAEFSSSHSVTGEAVFAEPLNAAPTLANLGALKGAVVLMERGETTFVEKSIQAQTAGAIGAVILNEDPCEPHLCMVAAAGEEGFHANIPIVSVGPAQAATLRSALLYNPFLSISIQPSAGLLTTLASRPNSIRVVHPVYELQANNLARREKMVEYRAHLAKSEDVKIAAEREELVRARKLLRSSHSP